MGMDPSFDRFAARHSPRLRLLVDAVAADRRAAHDVHAETWLIARHHWHRLRGHSRPDLWLFALALRMLRRAGPSPLGREPVVGAPPLEGLHLLDVALRPVVVLDRLVGFGVEEMASVLDLPVDRVRDHLDKADRELAENRAAGQPDGPARIDPAGPADPDPADPDAAVPELADLADDYRSRCADPAGRAALDGLVEAAVSYLGAEEAMRRDDLPAAEAGFAVAARAGFADAARRCAVVRRLARPPSPLSDDHDELVVAAAAGDATAMRKLLEIVVPLVTRYCRARATNVKDSALSADDIAQEAVTGIVAALPRYVPGIRPFVAFAMRVASNKVYDAHRTSARRPTTAIPDGVEWADPAPGPVEHAARMDDVAAVRDLLGELSGRQRDILVMRLVCGMSADEVANVLSTTAGAVRVAQHRALGVLRERTDSRGRHLLAATS